MGGFGGGGHIGRGLGLLDRYLSDDFSSTSNFNNSLIDFDTSVGACDSYDSYDTNYADSYSKRSNYVPEYKAGDFDYFSLQNMSKNYSMSKRLLIIPDWAKKDKVSIEEIKEKYEKKATENREIIKNDDDLEKDKVSAEIEQKEQDVISEAPTAQKIKICDTSDLIESVSNDKNKSKVKNKKGNVKAKNNIGNDNICPEVFSVPEYASGFPIPVNNENIVAGM